MAYQFRLTNSLEKIMFGKPDNLPEFTRATMLKNEIFSFQLAGWFSSDEDQTKTCTIRVDSPLSDCICLYQVDYVPVMVPSIEIDDDEDYLTKYPGLFPDPLHKIKDGKLELVNRQTRAFWFTVEPKGAVSGCCPIRLSIFDREGKQVGELCCEIDILDAELPDAGICNTGWFHGDCLALLHGVEIMSEGYFSIAEKYLEVYVKFGHNMILTPVFTPPLDTDVGAERPTNQLVSVKRVDGKYQFEYSLLKRWIELCLRSGIRWFEISHLFTQWGAAHAPKIMVEENGVLIRKFGWETDALGTEYREFLHAFLPSLIDFLQRERVLEQCYFHISDEPQPKHEAQYAGAREILLQYISSDRLIDALHEYDLYEKGVITKPIVSNDHIHVFMEKGVKHLWTYYCMAQRKEVANRFIAMPAYRNRILGSQLYKNETEGFLQWGFNFWFTERSRKVLDPYRDTCAGGGFPSGDPFLVYPLSQEGEVVCSTRLYVFHEGLQDLRALKLLESLTDRQTVLELLEQIVGFREYPRSNAYILNVRETVNRMIQENWN